MLSCKKKNPIEVKQISTNEKVTIEGSYIEEKTLKRCFLLSIPVEFEITINSSINSISWIYYIDRRVLDKDYFDFEVYNKIDKTKQIFKIVPKDSTDTIFPINQKINLLIKNKRHLLSEQETKELLKKYHIFKSIDNLKSGDIIELVSCDKFREDNNEPINDYEKSGDKIYFLARIRGQENFRLRQRVEWYDVNM
ncbi:hypothetical protein [Flavobacterium sp. FlaQc-28]|uniref:hypothetical protein n=1 Tax=Flavobacterium sp. FlaQc-28 TaxID=3374178 RepID=UPI003756A29C